MTLSLGGAGLGWIEQVPENQCGFAVPSSISNHIILDCPRDTLKHKQLCGRHQHQLRALTSCQALPRPQPRPSCIASNASFVRYTLPS